MNYATIKAFVFGILLGIGGLLGAAQADESSLNFGIISTESQQNLKSQWTPFLQHMEQQTGLKVKAFFAPDYAGMIQAMRFNKVDLAWYGNLSAMEAVDRAGGQVFAQATAADGAPGYWSVLIVHKNSPINNLQDMLARRHELTFGNGDPNSTSGYLVPGYYVFAKNNVTVSEFRRSMHANHETNALAVANGQLDVATNNTQNLSRLQLTAPKKFNNLKVIWTSPLIAGDPIVWRRGLSAASKEKIYTFFTTYGQTAAEAAVLKGLGWAPFRASSDLQLVPIRQLALFKQMQGIKSNPGLSEADKKIKLAALQEQLSELDRLAGAMAAMHGARQVAR